MEKIRYILNCFLNDAAKYSRKDILDSNKVAVFVDKWMHENSIVVNNGVEIDILISFVSKYCHISIEEMKSASKEQHIVDARHIFICLCADFTKKSAKEICSVVNRDRTTYYHVKKRKEGERVFQEKIKDMTEIFTKHKLAI